MNRKYEAILFDLDGTLLPMDCDAFLDGYLHMLADYLTPLGYTYEKLTPAMWKSVGSMIKNNGAQPNSALFWQHFAALLGETVYDHIPVFDSFYVEKFNDAVALTAPTPLAREAVALAHEKAPHVVLATNPVFPRIAVEARVRWSGLSPDDFDLMTDYENSSSCKPNPAYFTEIVKKLGVAPQNCLMIGNNAEEDITAAAAAGLDTFLVTDCLIAAGELPQTPKGDFAALLDFLQKL